MALVSIQPGEFLMFFHLELFPLELDSTHLDPLDEAGEKRREIESKRGQAASVTSIISSETALLTSVTTSVTTVTV